MTRSPSVLKVGALKIDGIDAFQLYKVRMSMGGSFRSYGLEVSFFHNHILGFLKLIAFDDFILGNLFGDRAGFWYLMGVWQTLCR